MSIFTCLFVWLVLTSCAFSDSSLCQFCLTLPICEGSMNSAPASDHHNPEEGNYLL